MTAIDIATILPARDPEAGQPILAPRPVLQPLPRRALLARTIVATQLVRKPLSLRVLEAVIGLTCVAVTVFIGWRG